MGLRTVALLLVISALAIPKEAPKVDLSLKDSSGAKVSLRDYRGKIVILNFWATWCIPCNEEMPMIVELQKEYSSRGAVFIAASLDDSKTKSQIPAFVNKYQITFPVWYGATGDDLDKLGLGEAVPDTVFIDQEGHVVSRVLGQMRKEELRERLEWLTGDRSSPPPKPLVKHLDK